MIYLVLSFLVGGSLMVLWSRSPYYSVFGVLIQSLSYSIFLCLSGFPFFGLILLLVYVGGMLVVFLFSTVLSAERYPSSSFLEAVAFWLGVSLLSFPYLFLWFPRSFSFSLFSLSSECEMGEIMGNFGSVTCLVAIILLVALMVVFSLCFEHGQGSLRKL
uniref:NADH-ubiquinone oxidoreductase chain 6 n=1 Tax=Ophiocreas oedipus TaxID=876696 RepID=A0A8K1RUC4_9ECHI|nr:NADH dehydrogenase subunit 6 [Ophiocreas oedipus]